MNIAGTKFSDGTALDPEAVKASFGHIPRKTRASPTSRPPRRTRRPMITLPKPQPLLTTKLCEARITTVKAVHEVSRDA